MKAPTKTIATWHDVVDPRQPPAVFSLVVDSGWLDKLLTKHLVKSSGEPWHLWLTHDLLEELRAATTSDQLPQSARDRFLHLLRQDVDAACRLPLALTFRTRPERQQRTDKPMRMILVLPSGLLFVCQMDEPRYVVSVYFHWYTTRRFDQGEALNSAQAANRTIRKTVQRYCTSLTKNGRSVLQMRPSHENVTIQPHEAPDTAQSAPPKSREVHWDFEFITPQNWGFDDTGVFTGRPADYGRRELPKTGFRLGIVFTPSDRRETKPQLGGAS